MSDQEFAELGATAVFHYDGFLETKGRCIRCGKYPTASPLSLHRFTISGHPTITVIEVGPACLGGCPGADRENWKRVYTVAMEEEQDSNRAAQMLNNYQEIAKAKIPR